VYNSNKDAEYTTSMTEKNRFSAHSSTNRSNQQ